MYYPNYLPDTNTRAMVDTWRGYNHNYRISAGEFFDMENLSSDYYPLLTPRKTREKLIEEENIRGILLTDNKLCYLAGKKLHFGFKIYDLAPYIGDETGHETDEQQLIRFGAYILIFPLRIYVNLTDDEDIGSMNSSYSAPTNTEITYTMCDIDGDPFDNITVEEVRKVGLELGLPYDLIYKTPADGLCGKTDEDNLGFTYAALDKYLRTGICDPEIKAIIDRKHDINKFKLEPIATFEYGKVLAKTR